MNVNRSCSLYISISHFSTPRRIYTENKLIKKQSLKSHYSTGTEINKNEMFMGMSMQLHFNIPYVRSKVKSKTGSPWLVVLSALMLQWGLIPSIQRQG
jgi:hypothetical protein